MKIILIIFNLLYIINVHCQYAYNASEHGLLIRTQPDTLSTPSGILNFGEKIQIIERTPYVLTVNDNGKKLEARWYKISSVSTPQKTGYVFSGYLTTYSILSEKEIRINNYKLTTTTSKQKAFASYKKNILKGNTYDDKVCVRLGLIHKTSNKKVIKIKLMNDQSLVLKKDIVDDQFLGYNFLYYDTIQKLYFIWENWLEDGYPIMIQKTNGKVTKVIGSNFEINSSNQIMALYGEDIGSGWTPNGIQLLKLNHNFEELFYFNPRELVDENWGPIDLVWADDSNLIIKCLIHNVEGGYITIYKKLNFIKY